MYEKLFILFPFLIPPKKNAGRMKGERSNQILLPKNYSLSHSIWIFDKVVLKEYFLYVLFFL